MSVRRSVLVGLLLVSMLAVSGASAGAQTGETPKFGSLPLPAHTELGNLDSQLSQVARASQAHGGNAALETARAESLAVSRGKVRVVVVASGTTTGTEAAVASLGGEVEASADGLVQALVPPGSLQLLAASAAVTEVRQPATPFPQAVDEGVAASGADAWHTAGYDGAGVKVAIIDLGFAGYASLLGTALPASVTTIDHCGGNLATPSAAGGAEHGTAVAELVHQMAPGAQLSLICIDSEVTLALAEQDAVNAGVKIINHSVGWLNTSRGDGVGAAGSPDATVADARAHGILWINAAGNYAQDHWSGTFTGDSANADLNDFAPGVTLDTVTIQSGEQGCAFLKWDAWPVTSEDYDLYLVRASDDQIVAASVNDQSGSIDPADGPGPPTEELCYTNTGATQVFGLGIGRFSASTASRLDLYFAGSSTLEYATAAGSLAEPASSPDAIAVGAGCLHTGAPVELFSSTGPTIDGREKPDLVAPDGVSTSTYGAAAPAGCELGGFLGTSAAAPQVAGAAAIALQRYPSLTPAGVASFLESTSGYALNSPLADQYGGELTLPPLNPIARLAAGCCATINEDGSGEAFVFSDDSFGAEAWNPDGRRLLVVVNTDIYSVNSDDTARTQLTHASGAQSNRDGAWSPDGSKIAYQCTSQICVMNADGSGNTQLTTNGGSEGPLWSPDGSKIAWTVRPSSPNIWVMNANGSGQSLLLGGATVSAWSPDGTRLAYTTAGGRTVSTMNANGTGQSVVTTDAGAPSWSPDGALIAVQSGEENRLAFFTPAGSPVPVSPVFTWYPLSLSGGVAWQPTAALATTPEATTNPSLGGIAVAGASLTAGRGSWTGVSPMRFTYQWQRCGDGGTSCSSVVGATDNVYKLGGSDVGKTLRVAVTSANPNGASTVTSPASSLVAAAVPVASSLPTFSGTALVGQTVSVTSNGIWTGSPSFTFQWRRCANDGGACSNIGGATGPSYTSTGADGGNAIRVAVTGANGGGSAVATSTQTAIALTVPGAPTGVSATAGNGQATVSFSSPLSNGGSPISSYTVVASPGGATATGSASPLTIAGLANGTSYTFTVKATNTAGAGPASSPSNAVTATAGSSGASGATGGGGSSGGGGGGGGGSSSLALTVSPSSQTVASGATATWTISVTNTGGAYLYAVGIGDAVAPGCGSPNAYSDTLSFMGPNVSVTYTCSLAGVRASLTNTIIAGATTGPGPTISTTVTASVTVPAASPAPSAPVALASPKPAAGISQGFATLVVSKLKTVVLAGPKPRLGLTVRVSKPTTLVLTLVDSKGHRVARWIEHQKTGSHKLSLLLPPRARHKGHDTLRITETGLSKPKMFPVVLTL